MQVTHDNHFVPQSYLKRWSQDGHRIWCYRTLVSHEQVREWELKPIQGVAYQRDLYTTIEEGQEVDEFEKWIESEFEMPAQNVIERAIHNDVLNPTDWERLILYVVSQDIRTPLDYIESMERWNERIPAALEKTLADAIQKLEKAAITGEKLQIETTSEKNFFADTFKVNLIPSTKSATKLGEIEIGVKLGRSFWLAKQRHLLTNLAKQFAAHHWSIVEAALELEWFTSDNPVACVNYSNQNNYDLKGGWGKEKGNILMPLSSRHLLFTQIGESFSDRFTFSFNETRQVQKLIADNAHRMIFAKRQMREVKRLRPRIVNPKMYQEEQDMWKNWHKDQKKAEQDL